MSEVYKALQPEKYLKEFISREIRPDGRKFDAFRWTVVNPHPIKTADGSCIAKIGHTKIVCGIKAELTTPTAEKPKEGFVIPNLELPPLCSAQFKPGPPAGLAQACNQLVADILVDSQCIDLEDLCIHNGKLAWVLYCDMTCVDFDGSIIDACVMALMTALKTVKLPKVKYNPVTEMCVINENDRRELKITRIPIASTFTTFEGNMLADPTNEEEKHCGGPLGGTTIVRGVTFDEEDGKVRSEGLRGIHRCGGIALPPPTLQKAISMATKRAKQIHELINTALHNMKEDQR